MTSTTKLEKMVASIARKRGPNKERCQKIHRDVDRYLSTRQKTKPNSLGLCKSSAASCACSTPLGGVKAKVDLVVLIDTSGSMSSKGAAISKAADKAIAAAQKSCPSDLRITWLGLQGTFPNTKFSQTHRNYINSLNLSPAPAFFSSTTNSTGAGQGPQEEGADASADLSTYFDWREGACRAVFYISDEPLDQGRPQNVDDDTATANAISIAKANNVSIFTHLVQGGFHANAATIANYKDLSSQTGGAATIGGLGDEAQYNKLLADIICNACGGCKEVKWPDIHPCISVSWGDGKCDSLETDDLETLSISVCNCYSNVVFKDFEIGYLFVTDAKGKLVSALPDGTPSVEAIPLGPICFGDIPPCKDGEASCVTREFVLSSRGARAGKYQLQIGGICYHISNDYLENSCFEFELCKS